jgi:hypothetical protein
MAADLSPSASTGDALRARIRWAWRLFALLLASGHTAAAIAAESMNEDGISYLDMGDAILRGEWGMAINSVWSPLYAGLLGGTFHLFRPGIGREFATVHVLNLAVFLLALACFEYYWRGLRVAPRRPSEGTGDAETLMPWWAWTSIGYALFLWSSLNLIRIWAVTPDMLLAALVFLAAGLALRMGPGHCRRSARLLGAAFGLVLGLGYLAKAVLFPVAAVFLGALVVVAKRERWLRRFLGPAVVSFLLVAMPWAFLISVREGSPTIGEAGRLTYLRYVNGVPYPFWEPGHGGQGAPVHPPRRIFESPAAYEFAGPIGGTYPLSYDPAFWYRGVQPRLDLAQQAGALATSALAYTDLFARDLGGFMAGLLALLLLRARAPRSREPPVSRVLVAVGLTALTLYGLVYVEGRYIAPFVILVLGGLLREARLPAGEGYRRTMAAASAVMLFFVLLTVAVFNAEGMVKFAGFESGPGPVPSPSPTDATSAGGQAEAARALLELGVVPGEKIAFVGYAFGAYFARLADVRITRQVPDAAALDFWQADDRQVQALLHDLLDGPRAVVTDWTPAGPSASRWQPLGESPYHVYVDETLRSQRSPIQQQSGSRE